MRVKHGFFVFPDTWCFMPFPDKQCRPAAGVWGSSAVLINRTDHVRVWGRKRGVLVFSGHPGDIAFTALLSVSFRSLFQDCFNCNEL